MDNSPEYIKMCRNHWIQESWKPVVGDFVSQGVLITVPIPENTGIELYEVYTINWITSSRKKEQFIFLPRQGQLQDMVGDIKDKAHRQWRFFFWAFHGDYLPITNHCSYIHFMNMVDRYDIEEILWLAFVMHEKFNKKWNGEEWI